MESNVGFARPCNCKVPQDNSRKRLLKKFYKIPIEIFMGQFWFRLLHWRKFRLEKLKHLEFLVWSEKQMASAIVSYSFIHLSTKFSLMFFVQTHGQTTDAQWSLFSLKSRTFGLGQINRAVSLLSMFSIIQPLFLQKS